MDESWAWCPVRAGGLVPLPRHVSTAVTFKDSMYLFGGYGTLVLADFVQFSFETREWSEVRSTGPMPCARHSHIAVIFEEALYIFGGVSNSKGQQLMFNDLHKFSFADGTWEKIECKGALPSPRWAHTGLVYGRSLVIFGGFADTYTNDLYQLNFDTMTWSVIETHGDIPRPRHYHSAAIYQDRMYVLGGFPPSNSMYEYSFTDNYWKKAGSFVSVLRGHSAIVYRDSMFIFGGQEQRKDIPLTKSNKLYRYSFETREWTRIGRNGSAPTPRYFHCAVMYGASMYIFGGLGGKNQNDITQFCFETEKSQTALRSLACDLRGLVNDRKLSDITFIVEGKEVFGHKNILCARCDRFQAMLFSGMKESAQDRIPIEGVTHDIFLSLLEFIYTDDIQGQPDLLWDVAATIQLLQAADEFLLPGLKELCGRALSKLASEENICALLDLAVLHDVQELRSSCVNFIKEELTSPSSFFSAMDSVAERIALLEEKLSLLSTEARLVLVANGIEVNEKTERKEKKKGNSKKKKKRKGKRKEKEREKEKET